MKYINKSPNFFSFVVMPLFVKGRWFAWVILISFFGMMGNSITAIRMDIPSVENLDKISGEFIDTGYGYGKGILFDIGIRDAEGVTHRCNCEPLPYSNCLGRSLNEYRDIVNQLDKEVLKNHAAQKAIVKWLSGRKGEVWMYPNKSLFGTKQSCYQISSGKYVLWSYDQAVREYKGAKSGLEIYLLWCFSLSVATFLSMYLFLRVYAFVNRRLHG